MRKFIYYSFVFAFLLSANTSFAADSSAQADGEAGAESGGASASTTSMAQGNAYAVGGSVMTFEGSEASPYMPGTIGAPVLGPTLFNFMGRPAQVNGIPLLANNLFPVAVREVETGESNATKIVYNGSNVPLKQSPGKRGIYFDFSGQAEGELVGSITIQSKKHKGDEVDVPTLIYDATRYIEDRRDLRGYNVTLLTIPQGISYAMGVDSKGKGFSLSPVVSGLINGPAGVLAGAASGFAGSKGITTPTGLVGCTFLVVIDSDRKRMLNLSSNYGNGFNGNGHNENGNGRKKYEAEQESLDEAQ